MTFHIITLFPDSFDSYVNSSIIGRAIYDKKIKIKYYNPRDFSNNKFKHIDQKPYSGGPGMVIQALPVIKAIEKANKNRSSLIIWLSPSGKQFNNEYARKTAKKYKDVIIICGRYEGIDERVRKVFKTVSLSIGPYVLTGGELPAMVIMDSIARQIEGVLGNYKSLEESRISSSQTYTRPEVFDYKGKKYKVPKILLSGNHAKIEEWKDKKKK